MNKYILIHCTDLSYTLMKNQYEACNSWHEEKGFPVSRSGMYIGYHAIVTGDKLYRPKEDDEVGAHCNQQQDGLSMNFQSLGICIGFDGDIEMPTAMQYALTQKQIWDWQDKYSIPNENVRFHRFWAKNKTCPGSLITEQWLKKLITRPSTTSVIHLKPTERTCIAQEAVIKEQKTKLAWYEDIFQWIAKRWS